MTTYENPERLRDLRIRLGVTQAELAKTAKVSQRLVSAIESKQRSFVEPTRQRLWEALAEIEARRPGYVAPDESRTVKLSSLGKPQDPSTLTFDALRTIALLDVMGLDKTPEERLREENEQLKAENKAQAEQLALQQELINIIEKRDESWFKPLDEKLQASTRRISELEQLLGRTFDLLGIETEEGILRFRKEEVQEQIEKQYRSLPESPKKE